MAWAVLPDAVGPRMSSSFLMALFLRLDAELSGFFNHQLPGSGPFVGYDAVEDGIFNSILYDAYFVARG